MGQLAVESYGNDKGLVGERAKQARHSQVCSFENCGYIYYKVYIVRANFVLITRKEGGA